MIKNFLVVMSVAVACGGSQVAGSEGVPTHGLPAGDVERIVAAIPEAAPAQPAEARRVLVFSRAQGFRHESIPRGQVWIEQMGARTGAFEVVISDDLAMFEEDALAGFHGVVFNNTSGEVFLPTSSEAEGMSEEELTDARERDARLRANLMAWIEGGGAFIGIHAATDTLYDWAEYGRMIGGYFDGHPWNADARVTIKVESPEHPLNAAFADTPTFELTEEIYQFREPYEAGRQQVLLRLDRETNRFDLPGTNRDDKDFPLSWIRTQGEGRVFYFALGHNAHIFENPALAAHFLAGMQWALGDLEAPTPPGD